MLEISNKNNLSIINDPFGKESIKSIHIHAYPRCSGNFSWSSSIEFENGLTEGKQKFKETDFEEITIKMKEFIESLKK